MIGSRELQQLRAEWTLDVAVIEKDYVLGWLLAGIAQHRELNSTWVFKGGTCLRKCYYETFRFSEDLDFTVVDGGPEEPGDLQRIFGEIAEWLREESGIALVVDELAFRRRRNLRGRPTTQGRIAYSGPNPQPVLPKVKLDITADWVGAHAASAALLGPARRDEAGPRDDAGPAPTEPAACRSRRSTEVAPAPDVAPADERSASSRRVRSGEDAPSGARRGHARPTAPAARVPTQPG